MLFEMHIKYKDGKTLRPIVYAGSEVDMQKYTKSDDILAASFRPFKYKVVKEGIIPPFIIKLGEKKYIYPNQIECHSKTTLEDIKVIKSITSKQEIQSSPLPPPPNTFTFKSSSSDSTYTVKEINGVFKCNCPGFFRAKDKNVGCKHIQSLVK